MTSTDSDLDDVLVTEREHWEDGPPHELFKRAAGECPVHWTAQHHRVPRRGRLLVGDDGRRRPRRSAATGRPTPPSSAASPR